FEKHKGHPFGWPFA
ncbi:hypothetical protein ECEC1848_4605, partial [Escherichia coli EC1848]